MLFIFVCLMLVVRIYTPDQSNTRDVVFFSGCHSHSHLCALLVMLITQQKHCSVPPQHIVTFPLASGLGEQSFKSCTHLWAQRWDLGKVFAYGVCIADLLLGVWSGWKWWTTVAIQMLLLWLALVMGSYMSPCFGICKLLVHSSGTPSTCIT